MNELQERIKQRLVFIAETLYGWNSATQTLRVLLAVVLSQVRKKILKVIRLKILSDLVRYDQVEDWEVPPIPNLTSQEVQLVLAELMDPANGLLTVQDLVKAACLPDEKVGKVLAFCQSDAAKWKFFELWQAPWTAKNGDKLYTILLRKPTRIARLFVNMKQ